MTLFVSGLKRAGLWHLAFLTAAILAALYGLPWLYGFVFLTGSETRFGVPVGIGLALAASAISTGIVWRLMQRVHIVRLLLILSFLCGMAAIPLHGIFPQMLPGALSDNAIVDGGVFEELMKGLFVLLFALGGVRHFCGAGAGFVIGWFVGMGFEFLENVSYMRLIFEADEPDMADAYTVRLLAGAFNGHPLDTGLCGAILGWAVPRHGRRALVWAFPVAILPGMALHMLNNNESGFFIALGIGFVLTIFLMIAAPRRAERARAVEAERVEVHEQIVTSLVTDLATPGRGRHRRHGEDRAAFTALGQLAGLSQAGGLHGPALQELRSLLADHTR